MKFDGPSESMIELRMGAIWSCLVNGIVVEDYSVSKRKKGDESLRQLKSKPDGSYLIQPAFDATQLQLNIVRRWSFLALGEVHSVSVAHKEYIWQVMVDDKLVDRMAHAYLQDDAAAHFDVVLLTAKVKARLDMTWDTARFVWRYVLTVNGVHVPICWSKVRGDAAVVQVSPLVVLESATLQEFAPVQAAQDSQDPPILDDSPLLGASAVLPQGVSFDSSTGAYQANIRSKTGRFVFLGEFLTSDEAAECYVAAIPK
eukprot:CAMPEP_0194543284 /NCGR_PEP_ID=MMETSP0253-20130528/85525_1 /TAXON_ID=2966 /ORGANISM="Noctiluca scintillans" /LENGTH=256 /DNA_ID=CAMNT_0039390025 /DNA_START=138 /DNA_END=905 /DNA_ORIENTATION=-